MLLRHEGKGYGVGPLEGEVRMTYLLRPAVATEKTTLNDYPPLKPLIAGTDPLSLTRNDYKKNAF